MSELEPTRANDALVAEAMGWTGIREVSTGFAIDLWGWEPNHSTNSDDPRYSRAPAFLTDPAQVVPMLERIGTLVDGPIDLCPPRSAWAGFRPTPWRLNIWRLKRSFDGTTANLAVANALLATYKATQGGPILT